MTQLPIPRFSYDPERNRATIQERFSVPTRIRGFSITTDWCRIDSDGLVTSAVNYEYDFASGAIDTVTMIVPTLVHDIICQLTDLGLLPWSVRKKGDKEFRRLMGRYGVVLPRRIWCYIAVRYYSLKKGFIRRRK